MKIVSRNKRFIMTGIINGILGCMFLLSCTVSQTNQTSEAPINSSIEGTEEIAQEDKQQKYNVEVSIMEHIPYCGGAAPDPRNKGYAP